MRLVDVRLVRDADRLALVGRVQRRAGGATFELFFRFPADAEPLVATSADPFLAALLVPALFRGEPLTIDPPVSARLLRRTIRVQDILTMWYPQFHRVDVDATTRPPASAAALSRARGVGAFFSGGVDSCYTLMKSHHGWPSLADRITQLVFVKGFDAPLEETAALAESEAHLRRLAERYGCELIAVETNLRAELDVPWAELHLGAALAAVGLSLGRGLGCVLISSTHDYGTMGLPHGSHPLVDELWSTEEVEIIHDGCETTRVGKLAAIAAHEPALLAELRVCWEGARGGPRNCGRCGKCIRTATMLRAIGRLGVTAGFPPVLPRDYASHFDQEPELLADVLVHARTIGDTALIRTLERHERTRRRRAGVREMLRAVPLTASLLDARAALHRLGRAKGR